MTGTPGRGYLGRILDVFSDLGTHRAEIALAMHQLQMQFDLET